MNEIVDIDGFGQKEKPVVSVIGGFLGQLMIVLHTIARHYKKLDQPASKSRASSRHADSKSDLRPNTGDSGKDH